MAKQTEQRRWEPGAKIKVIFPDTLTGGEWWRIFNPRNEVAVLARDPGEARQIVDAMNRAAPKWPEPAQPMTCSEAAAKCLRPCRGALTDEQYRVATMAIDAARSDAFDFGHKAAGGTMIPDGSKFIELALDHDQIDALCLTINNSMGDGILTYAQDEALKRFLEIVSIHRSRK